MQKHYNNKNGSLYKFAEDHDLNAYEFDIVKRIVRCRKKGEFLKDLHKTKDVIDLYIKEQTSTESKQICLLDSIKEIEEEKLNTNTLD